MKTQFDPQAPMLIIGAGRSGSTLLSAILDHHPQISFFGESYFLAPFIWERIFNQYRLIMSYLSAWRNDSGLPDNVFRRNERKRIGECIAKFVTEIMRIDSNAQFWGYKEIWNGSPHFETFSWDIYKQIFPEAYYIHIVRNPIRFAISTAGRSNDHFTRKVLLGQLKNWVAIHEYNMVCAKTKRYHLVRYEDLIENPEQTLKQILNLVNITWNDRCLKALEKKYVPSTRNPVEDETIFQKQVKIANLAEYIEKLGYTKEIEDLGIKLGS